MHHTLRDGAGLGAGTHLPNYPVCCLTLGLFTLAPPRRAILMGCHNLHEVSLTVLGAQGDPSYHE